jgi:hypothetical protein
MYHDPFAGRYPDTFGEYDQIPSTAEDVETPAGWDLENAAAEYRLVHSGTPVEDLPRILVGRATVEQTDAGLWHQSVDVRQVPDTWPPEFTKLVHQEVAIPGPERHFTVSRTSFTLGAENLGYTIALQRLAAEAAVGFTAALFDERIAIDFIFEDVLVFDPGGSPIMAFDVTSGVRDFTPLGALGEDEKKSLAALHRLSTQSTTEVAAARWYLRAAQRGPTAEGALLMCIALEGLASESKPGKPSFDVRQIEKALVDTGFDITSLDPSVGRLAGLRAHVVHHGIERPEQLGPGFYALERCVRHLLRHAVGAGQAGWTIDPIC